MKKVILPFRRISVSAVFKIVLIVIFGIIAQSYLIITVILKDIDLPKTSDNYTSVFTIADNSEVLNEYSEELFSEIVFNSNNDTWEDMFMLGDNTYTKPLLKEYSDTIQTPCGIYNTDHGHAYCPLNKTIYLDISFFVELEKVFGVSDANIAKAYLISYETAHHVQNEMGLYRKVNTSGSKLLSDQINLQADCFVGFWVFSLMGQTILESGDIHKAMTSTDIIRTLRINKSDTDNLANVKNSTQTVIRAYWFDRGKSSGNINACNTYWSINPDAQPYAT